MIGRTISHYRILEKLGAGGMGVVYKAEDIKLQRPVALKFLPPQSLITAENRARFALEAQAAASLSHPNIATIHEFDEVADPATGAGLAFIAMEYLDGETLNEKIRARPLPAAEAVSIAISVAEGLARAHQKGIIHRDIKSDNVMITRDGLVKIMDFGVAAIAGRTRVTREGMAVGTTAYMSPEQALGEPLDQRTDIWSLGVVLYEMATGRLPFTGEYDQAVVYQILNEEPEPLGDPRSGQSCELARIVQKAMQKNRAERYQDVDEFAADLRSLQSQSQSGAAKGKAGEVRRPRRKRAINSIAVLPLENLSRDPEQEYFADGMSEALTTDLAKIGSLKVISRTSVMRYKGTQKPLPEIARELEVDGVVEGSVLRVGDRVRITAQLIHADTDRHLWAESYERDVRDVLGLQSEVAQAIARAIEVKVKPQERRRLAHTRRVDPEAHEALLKARYHWNKWDLTGFTKSVEYYQRAIETDPTYAAAYAGLAQAYAFLGYWGYSAEREAYARARAAAAKAVEADESLGDAHSALGVARWFYDWDLLACEKELRRALELSPNDATARLWHAVFVAVVREDHELAVREARKAQELDPLSLYVHSTTGWILLWARRLEEAVVQSRKVLEMDPNYLQAHLVLGNVLVKQCRFEEAIAALERSVEISGAVFALGQLGAAYGLAGEEDRARTVLRELEERSRREFVPHCCFVWIHAALGECDQAFARADRAFEAKEAVLFWLNVSPISDALRPDPRFSVLLKRLGLKTDTG